MNKKSANELSIEEIEAYLYADEAETQSAELQEWYNAWLDVTQSKKVPEKPKWLK